MTPPRIVVLGGGFAGTSVVQHLESLFRNTDAEITLVSRDNFCVMTPLLFEVCSGTLDLRHCSFPIRAFLRHARFIEATVQSIDLDKQLVRVTAPECDDSEIPYDHLVLALGAMTNRQMIPGSQNAITMKTLADAFILRNHVIERFERADVETNPEIRRRHLTFAIIGGGLVGVELLGEMTAFVDEIIRYYPRIRRDEARFLLVEGADRIIPEVDPKLADYATRVLTSRPGVDIRAATRVQSIDPNLIHLPNESIPAATIILTAGILPSPVVAALPTEKDKHGHVVVDATMRSKTHPNVWALGDCANVPDPAGKPYPRLAQHAIREAKVLASNIHATLNGGTPKPFVYATLGIMGSLGHGKGFAKMMRLRLRGFPAWWVRRTYYLMQFPGWSRRFRLVIDWTFALIFRPNIVKIDMSSELQKRPM